MEDLACSGYAAMEIIVLFGPRKGSMDTNSSSSVPFRVSDMKLSLKLPMPPVHKMRSRADNDATAKKIEEAIKNYDSRALSKAIIEAISSIPFRERKGLDRLADGDPIQLAGLLSIKLSEIYTKRFQTVDLVSAVPRDVSITDWSTISAVRRSEAGASGIYFIECADSEVVVVKPVLQDEFVKTFFLEHLIRTYFGILCPATRLIQNDGATKDEHQRLYDAVHKLNTSLAEDEWLTSPLKTAFSYPYLMVLELVKGCTLCHRTAVPPQRPLGPQDYNKLGSLFLFDLLIRNTDRFPSRRAFPRPGICSIEDSGNPGNMMFGPEPGMVWSIDKEMVISVDSEILDSYVESVVSIAEEILFNTASDPKVQSLVQMWSEPWPFLTGQAELSLEDSNDWSRDKGEAQALRHNQLNILRSRIDHCRETAAAARRMASLRAGTQGVSSALDQTDGAEDKEDAVHYGDIEIAPMSDDEGQWREWARASLPTAISDVLAFIQAHTGYITPSFAMQSFREGFIAAMLKACNFYRDVTTDPAALLSRYPKLGIAMMKDPESVHLPFIRKMCLMLQDILKHAVNNCPHVFPPALKDSMKMFKANMCQPRLATSGQKKLKGLVRKSLKQSRSACSEQSPTATP